MTKRLWLIGLVLLLAIPFAFLLRDFVRDVLLVEILRTIWTVRILFDSLPQVLVWSVFVLMVLSVAVRSLLTGKRDERREPGPSIESVGQVQLLAMRIRSAAQGEYYSWNLARYLGKLVSAILAYNQATTPDRTIWQIRSGDFEAPEEVRTYLQSGRATKTSEHVGFLPRLWRYVTAGLQPHPPEPPLEAVVQFLEDKLEE